jgi:CRP/FNR family transcriptional regulator, nitrogen oxide reductase regulator
MTTNRWSAPAPISAAVLASVCSAEKKSRFLRGLTASELEQVFSASTTRSFAANSVVISEGDPADHFFLLTHGIARHFSISEEGRKVLLLWFGTGDIFGGLALLPEPSFYLLGTEMVKNGQALVWRRNVIRDLVATYPRLQENALSIASDYLTWYHASHMALISHSARQRLARVVTSLAEGIGHKVPGGIELDITNEQLANSANVTPFTASRLLSEWQRNGAVSKSRGKVVLRVPSRLFLPQV